LNGSEVGTEIRGWGAITETEVGIWLYLNQDSLSGFGLKIQNKIDQFLILY
jgi:very-short-patch-repair endonuclease